MTPKELLTAVRQAQGWPSNYRLARELSLNEQNVQRWNTGANAPDNATTCRLAALAGLDPDVTVAEMQAYRSSNPEDREQWQRIARRLQTVAAAVLAAILSGFIGGGPDAQARATVDISAAASVRAPVVETTHRAQYTGNKAHSRCRPALRFERTVVPDTSTSDAWVAENLRTA